MLIRCLVAAFLITSVQSGAVAATEERVPRVLLVGDSWTGFMQAFRSFEVLFGGEEYPELVNYAQVGYKTAIMGVEAARYLEPDLLYRIDEELADYPTLDVIAMTLGGNDIRRALRGGATQEMVDARIAAVVADIELIIQHILAIRPDIRIALIGYSDVNVTESGVTTAEVNAAFAAFELAKLDMTLAYDRVS